MTIAPSKVRGRLFTPEDKACILADAVAKNGTRNEIAARFGCSTNAIDTWMREAGLTAPRPRRDRTEELAGQCKPSRAKATTFQKPRCSRCGLPFATRSRTAILCSPCQGYANNNDF